LLLRAYPGHGGVGLIWSDLLLAGAAIAIPVGYVYGAQATAALGSARAMCWSWALALPLTLPVALLLWPAQHLSAAAWGSLIFAGTIPMWAGFYVWYRALGTSVQLPRGGRIPDSGGTLQVSLTLLLQPFFSTGVTALLLGQALEPMTPVFAVAVIAILAAIQKLDLFPRPVISHHQPRPR
jgi:drug/metabolite transporter (DMT)-like permease